MNSEESKNNDFIQKLHKLSRNISRGMNVEKCKIMTPEIDKKNRDGIMDDLQITYHNNTGRAVMALFIDVSKSVRSPYEIKEFLNNINKYLLLHHYALESDNKRIAFRTSCYLPEYNIDEEKFKFIYMQFLNNFSDNVPLIRHYLTEKSASCSLIDSIKAREEEQFHKEKLRLESENREMVISKLRKAFADLHLPLAPERKVGDNTVLNSVGNLNGRTIGVSAIILKGRSCVMLQLMHRDVISDDKIQGTIDLINRINCESHAGHMAIIRASRNILVLQSGVAMVPYLDEMELKNMLTRMFATSTKYSQVEMKPFAKETIYMNYGKQYFNTLN